jgi:hypothetical protein
MRDERTALTVAADPVIERWSLFDGQRTGHAVQSSALPWEQ